MSVTTPSWADRASAVISIFLRKTSMSPERISRSEVRTWLDSWAVTRSMMEWRSGGRSGDFEGRSERVVVRIWEERRVWRVVARVCHYVSRSRVNLLKMLLVVL
jgi:hypothetical protein